MADPTQIDLTLPYGADDYAEEYARRNLDREWAAYKQRQAAEGGGPEVRGAPGQGTEGARAPAPKSSFSAALETTFRTAREGLLTAVKPGPLSMQGAQEVVLGLMQTALAPVAGLAAGLGQEVENWAPDFAASEFLPGGYGGPAFTARHLASGAPAVNTLTPEQIAALSQPMTGREAVEFALQQAPFGAPAGKKVATAVKMQAPELRGQRGAMGRRPALSARGRELTEQALARYGTTRDIAEAGYILPDGTLLDFSGRHQSTGYRRVGDRFVADADDYLSGQRSVDHEDVTPLMKASTPAAAKDAFQHETGAVRLSPGGAEFHYTVMPTERQLHRIVREARQRQEPLHVDVNLPEGVVEATSFDRPTVEAVRNYVRTVLLNEGGAAGRRAVARADEAGPTVGDILRDERGSIGPPPEGAAFEGRPRPDAPPAAEAGPPVEPLTPPAGAEARINLARQVAPDTVKQVMTDISKIISTQPEIVRSRRTVSHPETIAEAATWTLDTVLATEPGTLTLNQVRGFQHAARDYFNAASHHADDLIRRMKAGDATAEAQWDVAETMLERLAALQELPGTELGRALEARSIPATMERAPGFTPEAIARIAAMKAGSDVPPRVRAAMYEALPSQAQRREYLRQKWEAATRGRDIIHQLWINSLLTNPVTHSANIGGTGLSIVWNLPEHYTAEIINQLFFRDPAGVQRGETAAMLRGTVEALKDGFRLSGKVAKQEGPVAVPQWVQRQLSPEAQAWLARAGETPLSGVEESLIAKNMNEVQQDLPGIFRIPTMALGVEDAFAKGVVYRQELKSLAWRQALNEGQRGAALEARLTELEAHPPGPMIAEAVDAAMLRTLNKELGPAGQAVMKAANTVPFGRTVLPFIRTPTNGGKWWGQRAPILAQLSAQNWRDISAGGAARDKALARQVLGAAAAAVIAAYVLDGTITGPGTADKRFTDIEREARPRNAICVKGQCYEYNRLDPVGGLFNLVAAYIEISSHIPTQDSYDEWAAYSEAVALAVGHVLVNKTSMQGFKDVLDAIEDPHRNVGKILSGYARSIVPAGVRATTRQMDDNIIREAQGMLDHIKSGLPYFVDGVPAHRNPVTGEPVKLPPGWGPDMLSPVFITRLTGDPVFETILKHRISLPPVPWYVGPGERAEGPMMHDPRGGRAVKLTPRNRDYWITAMTQEYRDGEGRTLHQALTVLVKSERFQNQSDGPDGGKARAVKTLYHAYMDAGALLLRRESPTLEGKIQEAHREQLRRRLPKTDPRHRPPTSPGLPLPSAAPRSTPSGLGIGR